MSATARWTPPSPSATGWPRPATAWPGPSRARSARPARRRALTPRRIERAGMRKAGRRWPGNEVRRPWQRGVYDARSRRRRRRPEPAGPGRAGLGDQPVGPPGDTDAAAKHGISTTTPEDAGEGAVKGTGIGLGVGILASLAALTVPGVGLVLGGGALAAALGATALTAGAGAIAGGVDRLSEGPGRARRGRRALPRHGRRAAARCCRSISLRATWIRPRRSRCWPNTARRTSTPTKVTILKTALKTPLDKRARDVIE